MEKSSGKKVLLAISGGIDSAVAVHLLQQMEYEVIGLHFNFWHWETEQGQSITTDSRLSEISDLFDIDIKVLEQQDLFLNKVVKIFADGQKAGLTPNPCVQCNPIVKFVLLKETADALGINEISTGHYARIEFDKPANRHYLKTGCDATKDQSYMLCYLDQDTLARTLFPLGSYKKEDIIRIGKEIGLGIKNSEESQDLCFVQPQNYHTFLKEFIDEGEEGDIVSARGEILGKHHGLAFFTIGQRKGIKVSAKSPYYVLDKDYSNNRLIVGHAEELNQLTFDVEGINWIVEQAVYPFDSNVKIRYGAPLAACEIHKGSHDRHIIHLKNPLRGITPGQYAVFYNKDVVLGGGMISRQEKE